MNQSHALPRRAGRAESRGDDAPGHGHEDKVHATGDQVTATRMRQRGHDTPSGDAGPRGEGPVVRSGHPSPAHPGAAAATQTPRGLRLTSGGTVTAPQTPRTAGCQPHAGAVLQGECGSLLRRHPQQDSGRGVLAGRTDGQSLAPNESVAGSPSHPTVHSDPRMGIHTPGRPRPTWPKDHHGEP